MADNPFTRLGNYMIDSLGRSIASYLTPERVEALAKNKAYFDGIQKKPLKLKPGQADDNLVINWVGLAVNRSNSMLMGGGVEFKVQDLDGVRQQWLDEAWNANKKEILLERTGLAGDVYGTWFMKILPEAREYKGGLYPRLVLLDTSLMTIQTDPMDIENVLAYVWEMKIPNEDRVVREITRQARADGEIVVNAKGLQEGAPSGSWVVEKWESGGRSSAWVLLSSTVWPYPFPPIIHCQNLPSLFSVYGTDGFSGGLDVQDRYNFVNSNISKIIRYHAHPKTWGRGMPAGTTSEKTSWGADELIKFSSETAELQNLEMQSDLGSSRNFAQDLKSAIFELARVVDIASVKDKIGQLTNFGLKVLYNDALAKNATRRNLYEDALVEINRRMFLLAGFTETDSEVIWGPAMPANDAEDAAVIVQDLNAGLVSKGTASELRGYQWETVADGTPGEQDRIAQEKASEGAAQANALANLFAGNTIP